MICSQKKSKKESRYNIIMQNELELKLAKINKKLDLIYSCVMHPDQDDRVEILEDIKDWIEGLLANYCE